ncbi:hypothetical protein [Aureispira anguillae]|uniref:Uncharacterized protein n=1 Tax=Aureispira anguillae TaxID=2864201 RepID=A0A915YET0_9BACT|nr:hypothetical protein [Aureispira anguillae]BDS11807.1 hypothetical protein AsAng_0025210 [Aureispira anguillae]
MKRFTLPIILVLLFATLNLANLKAQTVSERAAIKEWLIANQEHLTLLSSDEYQKLSPSVKGILDVDKRSLIYDQEVTLADISAFEAKNTSMDYVPFQGQLVREEQGHSNQDKVAKWLESNKRRNIKIISYQNYKSRSSKERAYIDQLVDKIIYKGETLEWGDIEEFEQSK